MEETRHHVHSHPDSTAALARYDEDTAVLASAIAGMCGYDARTKIAVDGETVFAVDSGFAYLLVRGVFPDPARGVDTALALARLVARHAPCDEDRIAIVIRDLGVTAQHTEAGFVSINTREVCDDQTYRVLFLDEEPGTVRVLRQWIDSVL